MKIQISPEGQQWFIEELELEAGDSVRFFGKYGGSTNVHTGFTTGMEVNGASHKPLASVTEQAISFFVESADDWFFHGYDLVVDYDNVRDEPTYLYVETVTK